MNAAHCHPVNEVLERFRVNPKTGLTSEQVKDFQKYYGKNELPEDPPTPLWELILQQFQDQLVIILLIAAGISFVLAYLEDGNDQATAYVEPIVILLILIANATVGVIQESNAEKAIEALKEYAPDEAKVFRNSMLQKINAVELVPGDIIHIAVGDKVPADCRVISITSSSLRADQAILTGESVSVSKFTEVVNDERAVKQDMVNILFSGTTVVIGKGQAVVVQIGSKTAIGDIHESITSQISEKTPLKKKLDDFGDSLAKVITVVCILVWLVNIKNFNHPSHHGWLKGAVYYFKIAVALAVAAIPEGLAVVITTCLALGTRKMAKKNAIVRSLPSVETLGCTSVICSDKTGTLTTNQMCVENFVMFENDNGGLLEYSVEGTSFAPHGSIRCNGQELTNLAVQNGAVAELARVCVVCNDSKIVYEKDLYKNIGEPTEAALKVLAEKIKTEDMEFNKLTLEMDKSQRVSACDEWYTKQMKRLITFEFSRDRKSMSVLAKKEGGCAKLYVKGAPESVLERCSHAKLATGETVKLDKGMRESLNNKLGEYCRLRALRCLALAVKEDVSENVNDWDTSDSKKFINHEQEMLFIGIVAMQDPPRPEVADAIKKCKTAGIRVIVITGDNKNTAEAICRSIGVFGKDEDLTNKSYTGREFDALTSEEKKKAVLRANLFSRTEPTHKSELVDLLQSTGAVVAMTGDGVNDAPALKKADIGVAMGSGTDVAKLASDMVLADDNFATIEKAVEEGRAIYNNTKQFIRYLISSNIGEVVSIFLTVLLGMPEALIPVQLLWVNLVTDGLPATALGFNPPDHDIMRMPPRNAREPIVGSWLLFRYMVVGGKPAIRLNVLVYVGAATVFGYAWWFIYYTGPDAVNITFAQLSNFHSCSEMFPEIGCQMFTDFHSHRATTMSLSILVVIEMFNAMNSLSENESLLTLPLWVNPSLVFAIALSMALHFMILYVPFFTALFAITPLNWIEWKAVLIISFPVIIIDEALKWFSRTYINPPQTLSKQ